MKKDSIQNPVPTHRILAYKMETPYPGTKSTKRTKQFDVVVHMEDYNFKTEEECAAYIFHQLNPSWKIDLIIKL